MGEDHGLLRRASRRTGVAPAGVPPKNKRAASLEGNPTRRIGDRLRSDSNLRLRWEIIEDLFFDITAYGSYDNKADANNDIDYGVTTGLGWEY